MSFNEIGDARFSNAQAIPAAMPPSVVGAGTGVSMYCACPPARCGATTRPPGDVVGDSGAMVGPDDVQAQIQAGGTSRAGEDIHFVDV